MPRPSGTGRRSHPARQFQQAIVPSTGPVVADYVGRSASHHHDSAGKTGKLSRHIPGMVAGHLLICPFVFLVHHDETQAGQRSEQSTPGTHHYVV